MPSKIVFVFRNLVDEATVTASPALLAGKPETNLQRHERTLTARSTSTASQEYRFSWPGPQTVDFIGIKRHNFTAAATLAAPTYSDSAFTTAIDTNPAANCFAYTGFGAEDVLTDPDFRLLKNSGRYLTRRTNVQSMKAVIADASNPDGYFDPSRMVIGETLELTYGVDDGDFPLTILDFSTQGRMDDGSLVSDKKDQARRFEIQRNAVAEADWARLLSGLRRVGKTGDFWMSIMPTRGDYFEAYLQGVFKVVDNPVFNKHFRAAAQTRIVVEET